MAFLMFVEGVLRTPKGGPIYQGLALYKLLNENNKVILLCDNKTKDDIWLRQHKINKLDDLIGTDIPGITDFPSWRQVEYVRAQGPVEMVICSDPVLGKRLLEAGITTLMFLQPSYITEGFRPDSKVGVKSWSAIVDEIVKQQEQFTEDPRVQE